MLVEVTRRLFVAGGLVALAAPAVVRAASIMRVRGWPELDWWGMDLASGPDRAGVNWREAILDRNLPLPPPVIFAGRLLYGGPSTFHGIPAVVRS